MANLETRTRLLEDGHVVEVALSENDSPGTVESRLEVPDGCPALAITLTGGGPNGLRNAPRGTSIEVRAPSGEVAEFRSNAIGQQALVVQEPEPGPWSIIIRHEALCDAEVNASALPRGWRQKIARGARWFSCKACKYGIKAFVIALMVQLGPVAAAAIGAEEILNLAGTAFDALCAVLSLDDAINDKFLTFIVDLIDNPIDRILERICAWLKLCRLTHR